MPIYEIEAPNGKTYEIEGPEGASDDEVIAAVLSQFPEAGGQSGRSSSGSSSRPSRNRSSPETYGVLKNLISQRYPHAKFTSDKRSPEHNRKVGGVENSYHVTGHGIDLVGLNADERSDLKQYLEDQGIKLDEYLYHKVKGGGLHLHIGTTHVPEELFPDYEPPEDGGLEVTVTDDAPPEQSPAPEARQAPSSTDQGPDSRFFGIPSLDELGKGLEYGAGAVVEGVGDAVGVITNPFATILGRQLGYDGYTADLGGDLRDGLGLDRPEEGDTANRITGDVVSGVAGGLGFSGLAGIAGRAAKAGLTHKALAELGRTPVRDAIAGGSAALAGDAAEAAGAGAIGQTAAALAGGALGYGGASAAKALTPEARATRFAEKQARTNPAAPYDAEIVADLVKTRETLARSKTDPKARAPLDVKAINDVQDSYTDQTMELIKQLGLPKMERIKYQNALSRKHSMPQEEIDALRGTVAGDAVADALTKVQRIKTLTPEIAREKSLLARTGEVVSTGLDITPGVPGIVGRSVRWATRAAAGDAEAARVHAAERLLKKKRGYEKLGQKVGPSGQIQSRQALWDAASEAVQASEAEKAAAGVEAEAVRLAKSKDAAWRAKQKMEGATGPTPARRRQDEDRAWNARNRETSISDAEKQRQMDAAWKEMEPAPVPKKQVDAEVSQWNEVIKTARARTKAKQAALKASAPKVSFDPPKPAKPPKPLSIRDQLIEKAMAQGVKGSTRTREVFRERLGGIDDNQLDEVLNTFEADNPFAADEVARIRMNQPTTDKRFGSAADPLLKAAMKKLGIEPQPKAEAPTSIPVDEAAQSRLDVVAPAKPMSQREIELEAELEKIDPIRTILGEGEQAQMFRDSDSPDDVLQVAPEVRKRSSEIQEELRRIRQVDRPVQWEQGKNRFQAQANDAIDRMRSGTVNPDALGVIGNAPVQMRDNFKTTEDALRYMDEKVIPDLRAEGFSNEDIDAVRSHLSDIAHAKPYYDEAAYKAGTKANRRGRPRNEK